MTEWKPDLCIYHGNCDDGFGAAWAIWRRWPDVEFVPGVYGKPLPSATGKNVLFVDFSDKRPGILAMGKTAKSVVIIDHHKTAAEELTGFPIFDGSVSSLPQLFETAEFMGEVPVAVWFDMGQSGALMAWQFATNTRRDAFPPPQMLAFIEDRDLWHFTYGLRTKRFSAALRTYPQEFAVWDKIAAETETLMLEGVSILRAHELNVQKILAEAYWDDCAGVQVPMVNAPYHYASDCAEAMLALYPDAPFVAAWFRRGDGFTQWSLRSEDRRTDVSAVAKARGGGGHRNAAGFQELTAF